MSRALRGQPRLERLAAPLSPTSAPYHVDSPRRGHDAPGWYWQPKGAAAPIYLAFNHISAETRLRELLEEADAARQLLRRVR